MKHSVLPPAQSADPLVAAELLVTSPDLPPAPPVRPRSAVSYGVGAAGLAGLLTWFFIARQFGMDGPHSALMSTVFCGLPMLIWSLVVDKVHLSPTTGIDWASHVSSADVRAVSRVKLLGLWVTWAIIAAAYATMRYYWDGSYVFAMNVLKWAAAPLALLSIPYVLWLDRRLVEPRDGAHAFGEWLLGKDDVSMDLVWKHWRAWGVKAFYIAFMLSVVPGNFAPLIFKPWAEIFGNPVQFAWFFIGFLYMVDVHFATVGYVLTMRPLDAHIRTANPYGMAWIAALICYPPFVLMNDGAPLNYLVNTAEWNVWMDSAGLPTWAFWIWGGLLVALTTFYAAATMAFGLRFSNLTHRGIITHGPFAITRHPAYLSKNIFWWLSSLVFLPWDGSFTNALRNTIIMALVSGVYYWRAKTEEKHLLADPAYQDYWNWAQQHALIPRLFSRFTGSIKPLILLKPDDRVGPVT